mmetsp:Transcript_10389/g.24452  ORF Transcript_10389/g.24452 Transcript_10389/m.24452 type:complete len:560 (-) Transcript_10389:248-1927(-)
MDGKLAEMLARRKKQQEEAEEDEWKPSSTPVRSLQQPPAEARVSASPTPSPETEQVQVGGLLSVQDLADVMDLHQNETNSSSDAGEKPEEPRSSESQASNAEAALKEIEELNASMEKQGFANHTLQPEDLETVSCVSPRSSPPSALPLQPVAASPPAQQSCSRTGSVESEGQIKRILKPTGSFKSKQAQSPEGGSSPISKGGLKWRDERLASEVDITKVSQRPPKYTAEDHSTVAYRMTGGQDQVPVLVIPTGDNWRTGAQASSTAFNTLQNQLGINLRENPNEVPDPKSVYRAGAMDGPNQQSFKGKPPADTMAKAKSRVLSSYGGNTRNIGTNALFPKKDQGGIQDLESLADGEHVAETRVSVPASSRSNLLDNNVLALSTGTVEERAEAARRICRRAKTAREVSELVDNGVIGSIGPLLSDPRGVDAAIEALLRLCSAIKEGTDLGRPETQKRMELELCASLEENGVAERLAALICWSRDESLKGRMALLIFHMAQNQKLANRVIVQDGAIAALVHLLDSPMESASASAAAALANISYWSTEPAPRLSHFKILCAL